MELWRALKRLWRHADFRRLLALRTVTQAADGTLQVGIASYVLFSPQSQPNAWAIAGVLAISLLPYTILGPFVSPLLDRWSRRNVALYSDVVRTVIAITIGGIIFSGAGSEPWGLTTLAVILLIALSLNRFMLAGLSAGLQHTVSEEEYLSASSIIPTVGPLGVIIGGVLGFGTRFVFGQFLPAHQADAIIFLISAGLFLMSAFVASGFGRDQLGPGSAEASTVSMSKVLHRLSDAFRHLKGRSAAAAGLLSMTVTRFLFGMLSVIVILIARNRWHDLEEPEAALVDISAWGACTGAGFLLSAAVVPALVKAIGLRNSVLVLLGVGGLAQIPMVVSEAKWLVFVASFFVGLVAQAVKICVDGIVQAHVDEEYKGRAFTFYDMGFNGAYVLAAVTVAAFLPLDGHSPLALGLMAVAYFTMGGIFWAVSSSLGVATFDRGTEDLFERGDEEPAPAT